MRAGLIASLAGHTALLLWGLIAFPDAKTFDVKPVDSLPVDLVPISELTRLQKGEKDAKEIRETPSTKPVEKPKQETPKPDDAPGEAKTAQASTPPPTPAPTPEPEPEKPEPKKPEPKEPPAPAAMPAPPKEPKQEPKPVAEAPQPPKEPEPAPVEEPKEIRTTVAPKTKPKPPKPVQQTQTAQQQPKKDFNTNQIAALLNKVEPAGGGSQSTQPASLGSPRGEERVQMTQSELDALRGMIARCWSPPVGAIGAEDLKVRLQFSLNQSGEVQGSPEVLNSSSAPGFRAAASSAVRAVMRCAPYSLPIQKYDAWKEVIINFDPREMIGG